MLDYTGAFEKIAFSLAGAPANAVKILGNARVNIPGVKGYWHKAFYNVGSKKHNATAALSLDKRYTENLFKERLKKGFN